METRDYSTIWEEHRIYLSPATLRAAIEAGGFDVLFERCIPYALENSLVILARMTSDGPAACLPAGSSEAEKARRYSHAFPARTQALREFLASERRTKAPIAIFGAGHLAAKFVNLHNLRDLIDFVVDDHPRKRGLFMPGSKLPILGSAALYERRVGLCLLSLNPESEARVLGNHSRFEATGGIFVSIFPASSRGIRI
jgi:hypothetical protein